MDIKGETLIPDELIMEAMRLNIKEIERASETGFCKGLSSFVLEDGSYKLPEQKVPERQQRKDLAELLKIKKHFADLLGIRI
ncbi:MAG TPA: hypothetical protein PLF30_02355 [Candidatus Moranbacteria bacterium]|jgi:sulfur relay (sulfurtransferase) DsrF/TusC family protein|nr:hypothetical protein [Candidatus Moranbacteria bacterium]HOF42228.1 hypothetical protein [Candidatus Moranbacteria bacterium]HPX94373.1 hypothetical protein [Candidatus Moranbacteria bacterium]HQB59502.1 hypothetical protein [Candidatus Moranbacteria bacterium]